MGVAQTSRAAYQAQKVALDTQEGRVARLILLVTAEGKDITGAEIAQRMRIDTSSVSGRIGDIKDCIKRIGAYIIDGTAYTLEVRSLRKSNVPGHNQCTSMAYIFREKNESITAAPPAGIQISMFA